MEEDDIDWQETLGWSDYQVQELRLTGYSYVRQGKYDVAIKFFKALAAIDKESAYDLQTLGALYLELNDNESALSSLSDALKLQPNHNPTLLNQAKALFALGHKEEGLRIVRFLKKNKNPSISSMAKALLLAYA